MCTLQLEGLQRRAALRLQTKWPQGAHGQFCLQECASNHIVTLRGRSEQYFAADPELAKLDLIFVLTRMQIRMDKYPQW